MERVNQRLFGNTGRLIKSAAKASFWVGIPAVLICAIFSSYEEVYHETVFHFLHFITICLGGWAAVLGESVLLHSWGELVENSRLIVQQGVSAKVEPAKATAAPASPQPEQMKSPDKHRVVLGVKNDGVMVSVDRSQESIVCPLCGQEQRPYRRVCFNCGAGFKE